MAGSLAHAYAHPACAIGMTEDHNPHAFWNGGDTVTCGGWSEAKVEREASRAQAMAEAVIKSAIEEIGFKLATVSTPALVYLIENTMDDILWAAIDEILTNRKVNGYC